MKFLDSKSSQVKPFDAPDVTPVLGVATFLPCRVSPSTEITLFDLPVICISIILSLLKEGEKKELRLVSLVARSIVEGLGIKKMEIINQRTFTLASRCTSLQIVELQASNDDDVVKMTSLAASLPLLDTLIIRIKAAGSPDCRGWRDRLLGSKRETTRAKYQPSPSVLLALFRSLDYHRRRGKPSPINTICHFPVGLVILTALNLKSDSCLSISLTETLEIASHVPLSRHVTLSEVKIDLQLTMAGTTSSICWPPRLKKLDIGFPQGLRPSNSGNDLVLSAITMGGLLSLTSSLEALVVRGEVILAPCIFKLFGQLVRLSSLTIWTKSWVEINNLSNLSLLPSLTSLQVARLDLGHEANFNQPLCTVAHLNYCLLEGGHNVLSVAFPNISHATLRDFPSSSSPGFLSGSNRSLTHLTLMQHSPCPPGLDPAAVNFNMLVHHHFHSLSSISGSVRVLTFKMIHQEHHIFSLFDLIRTNQFPSLRILNIMAKGDTAFIKYPHLTPLSSISRPRPITIQEIVIDAAHTSWAAHNLLAGCKLPHLKSLRILNQTAPISVNSLLAVIQGTGALRILELPFQSFSVQKAIRLKKHLRYKSSLNTQLSLEILEDPTDEKKSWGALIMSCVGPRDER